MAKKSKKQVRKSTKSSSSEITSMAAPQTNTSFSSSSRASSTEFNPDYSQTIKDLKRIGILAGTFFTVLVIISFFLR
jgi:hypothetical protein